LNSFKSSAGFKGGMIIMPKLVSVELSAHISNVKSGKKQHTDHWTKNVRQDDLGIFGHVDPYTPYLIG
jgi:hypothetical protein